MKKLDVVKLEDTSWLFPGKFEHIVTDKISRVYFSRKGIWITTSGWVLNYNVPKSDYNVKQMEKIGFKE